MAGNFVIQNLQNEEFRITHNDGVGAITIESDKIATKAYVDDLKTIAAGAATFTATTNNINLTGIGIGVEIGDVIQISGANDAKNNSEFTVEVITDDNNIIVNQAHANKGTTKNLATRSGDTGVTVKLLAKWYTAPIGLGQGWVDVLSSRASAINYQNNTGRGIKIRAITNILNQSAGFLMLKIDGSTVDYYQSGSDINAIFSVGDIVQKDSTYKVEVSSFGIETWQELR